MTTSPLDLTIHNNADLLALWQKLMGPWGFSSRTLWLVFLDEGGRTMQVIVPIEDVPPMPERHAIDSLRQMVGDLVTTGGVGSVPMLLSRPGPASMRAGDRAWACALRDGLGPQLCPWPIHFATKGNVRPFAPDDLIASSA